MIRTILLPKDGAIFTLDRVELDVKSSVLEWKCKDGLQECPTVTKR
jgi:hypothetical protein